jgi:hypothetical protein
VIQGSGVWCGGYRLLVPLCVSGCSSVVVGEGTCVRDCRGVGQMGLMCMVAV